MRWSALWEMSRSSARKPESSRWSMSDTEYARLPLIDLLLLGAKEQRLVKFIEGRCLLEEHRTAAPWSITNQRSYLEASRPVDGHTPLHVAAGLDLSCLCECIVRGGARIDIPDHIGRTALMVACARGHSGSVESLLSASAAHDAVDKSGKQPLHHTMHSIGNPE